jgi:hypothetical protein
MPSTLIVSLDTSQIGKDLRKQQKIKVAVANVDGKVRSQIVAVDGDRLELKFDADPKQALDLAIGPADASDEDIFRLQTISQRVLPTQWREAARLALEPIIVTPFFWAFWLRWCRNFTIHGRVVCANGRPVPGAVVQAFDVDFLWWWWSRQQAGPSVVTDANGSFTINFRWCCGWLPIWWWRLRHWALEPLLAGRILPVLRLEEKLPLLPKPDPTPDLRVFSALLRGTQTPGLRGTAPLPARGGEFDPTLLQRLRDSLLTRLPQVPELTKLRLWPWAPWTPWTDCTPDLIFRVTQNCGNGDQVIVSETVFDTRWDVPTDLTVTLTANSNACCTVVTDHPVGDCAVITKACQTLITDIEQNPSPLVGYANAGDPGDDADVPFGGVVTLRGVTGTGAGIDVYEIEHSTTPSVAASWAPVNPAVAGGFTRSYLDITPGPTITPRNFAAAFAETGGHNVVESLERFEATHPAGPGVLRVPVGGQDVLVNLLTADNYTDGAHFFRLKAYTLGAGGTLTQPRVLPLCNNQVPAAMALQLDNRFVDGVAPFSMPPPSPGQACGPGTVHSCTVEPDVRILQLQYNGATVQPCDVIHTPPLNQAGGQLVVDFFAHDPDGVLHSYDLTAHHGESLVTNLLSLPGVTLTPLSPAGFTAAQVGGIPQADFKGPSYSLALAQGAARPFWRGGLLRLVIPNAHLAFPDTCAYLLQINAYKRTIADCNYDHPYRNRSEFSLTVVVGP